MRLKKPQLAALLRYAGRDDFGQLWVQPGCIWVGTPTAVLCLCERLDEDACRVRRSDGSSVPAANLRAVMSSMEAKHTMVFDSGMERLEHGTSLASDLTGWPRGADSPDYSACVPWAFLRTPATGIWPRPFLDQRSLTLLHYLPSVAGAWVKTANEQVQLTMCGQESAVMATCYCADSGLTALLVVSTMPDE